MIYHSEQRIYIVVLWILRCQEQWLGIRGHFLSPQSSPLISFSAKLTTQPAEEALKH
jgi:hypothetical protein